MVILMIAKATTTMNEFIGFNTLEICGSTGMKAMQLAMKVKSSASRRSWLVYNITFGCLMFPLGDHSMDEEYQKKSSCPSVARRLQ